MIFIGGIHGVGKSYFCGQVIEQLDLDYYSASELISARKNVVFLKDKLIPDIDDNQAYLLDAVEELNSQGKSYLLDGHFCLYNKNREISRITIDTFVFLKPKAIILITELPSVIVSRLNERDNIKYIEKDINDFQEAETIYAREIAKLLNIPLCIYCSTDSLSDTLDFIKIVMEV